MTFSSLSIARALRPSPVGVVVCVLLASGVFLRLLNFGFPSTFLFDEHHFVENARNYLSGKPDWNDHPPLGKLIIALSISGFGDNSFAWRFPALIFGFLTIVTGGFAASRLFQSTTSGLVAAALLSADGFLIGYSRAGLLDGYLASLGCAVLLLTSFQWTRPIAILAGVLTGAACGIKFSGVGISLAIAVAVLTDGALSLRERVRLLLLSASVCLFSYWFFFAVGLRLVGQSGSPQEVIHETIRLLQHHAGLTEMKNAWTSGWPTWVLPVRPIMMALISSSSGVRAETSLGNLVVWWSAIAAGLFSVAVIAWRGIRAVLSPEAAVASNWAEAHVLKHGRATLIVGALALGFLAPWVLTHRDSYIYHFLPSYCALVILLAGFVAALGAWRRISMLWYLVIVLVVTSFYGPVWSLQPIDAAGVRARLFMPGWR